MNPDSSIGRVMTVDDALIYSTQVMEAEKVMGPLSVEEKAVILSKFGSDISLEDLVDTLKTKRVLVVKSSDHNAGPEHYCPECTPEKESQ